MQVFAQSAMFPTEHDLPCPASLSFGGPPSFLISLVACVASAAACSFFKCSTVISRISAFSNLPDP